jgi:hypothetical protein
MALMMDLEDLDQLLADIEHAPAAAAVPADALAPMPLPLAREALFAAPTQAVAPPVQLALPEPQHVVLPPVPAMPADAPPVPKCSWVFCPLHDAWCLRCSGKCARGGPLRAIARRWRA